MKRGGRGLRGVVAAGGLAVAAAASACGGGEPAEEAGGGSSNPEPSGPRVVIATDAGDIVVDLFGERAPATVENFLAYARGGHYEGLVFHRIVPGFVVQGGGHEPDLRERPPSRPPVRNESDSGLSNLRGTLAMARTAEPHSARAQFYINLADNVSLDYEARGTGQWGYAVFGRVVEGMDVVDEMAAAPTTTVRTDTIPALQALSEEPRMLQDVPEDLVEIREIRIVSGEGTDPGAG